MIAQDSVLLGDYTMRILEGAEFGPLFQQYRPIIFQTMLDFDVQQALSIEEQTATARLRERMGTPFRLNIGIYHHQEFIGWSFGRQESAERYYMVNTAILPQHQGKGIYSALLPHILSVLQREGFQIVYSRHVATNNQILVPKLKAGSPNEPDRAPQIAADRCNLRGSGGFPSAPPIHCGGAASVFRHPSGATGDASMPGVSADAQVK